MVKNDNYKIEAVVKVNNGEALVLNEYPEIKYEKYGNYLFGIDKYGIFVEVYKYENPSVGWEAFGGCKFDIPMMDGTIIKASGQWWDNGRNELGKALGSKIISVIVNIKRELKQCYVFCGLKADQEEYLKLRSTYTGEVYYYWEYKEILKSEVTKEK